jgi:HSP20 family molecular chaperone IbpA
VRTAQKADKNPAVLWHVRCVLGFSAPRSWLLRLGESAMANKQNDLVSFPVHLPQEIERLFEEIIHRPWGLCREIRGWNPSVDLYETADAFILEADLPGVKADDVKIEIDNGDLVLQGWRVLENKSIDGQFHTMERSSGHFMRRMKLPEAIDKQDIEAEFQDGVLRAIVRKLKHQENQHDRQR